MFSCFSYTASHLPVPSPPHLCGQVGRGRRRSPRGQCRWILGHRWQQHSHLGSLHSLCLPSHSHTHNGSCQPSSGRYPRFCSEGDSGSHIRLHLQSNPSLQESGKGTRDRGGDPERKGGQGLNFGAIGAMNVASVTYLSRPLGRGRCRRPVHPGKYPRSDIGARHSHLNLPHSLGRKEIWGSGTGNRQGEVSGHSR